MTHKYAYEAFLESANETINARLEERFRKAKMTKAQITAMQKDPTYQARYEAMAIKEGLGLAGENYGILLRAILQLLLMAEVQGVYRGFIPDAEYDSLAEFAEAVMGDHMERDLVLRYAGGVQRLLYPIQMAQPEVPVEIRIEDTERQLKRLEAQGGLTDDEEAERQELERELTALRDGTAEPLHIDAPDLIERVSNTKTIKELGFHFEQLEPHHQDEAAVMMWRGESHSAIRKFMVDAIDSYAPEEEDKDEEENGRPVFEIDIAKREIRVRYQTEGFVDELQALLGDKVKFRFLGADK